MIKTDISSELVFNQGTESTRQVRHLALFDSGPCHQLFNRRYKEMCQISEIVIFNSNNYAKNL